MTEWTCDDCGLRHTHRKNLHSLWNEMDWDKVKKLEYNPYCNCGAREAQERGFIEFGIDPPIPQETLDEIRESI